MSPRDYQWVKAHHQALVAKAKQALESNPLDPELRRKLARELWPLRALRNHHDLNQYL